MATIDPYPVQAEGGPVINQLIAFPSEYPVTRYEFEDGGCDVNVQPCGLKRWRLQYQGLSQAERQVIIDHFNDAQGRVNDFTFSNPQDGFDYEGVKYEEIEVPKHVKKWALPLNVTLFVFL